MAYPILSKDPEVLKTKTKGDESKENWNARLWEFDKFT